MNRIRSAVFFFIVVLSTSSVAGAAVGEGREGTAMRDHNRVVIRLRGTTEGVDVRLSIDVFALKVAQ